MVGEDRGIICLSIMTRTLMSEHCMETPTSYCHASLQTISPKARCFGKLDFGVRLHQFSFLSPPTSFEANP